MRPRSTAVGTALCALAALGGCVFPATEVLVVVDTNIDPSLPLTVTARAWRGRDAGGAPMVYSFRRLADDAGRVDGGSTLPASFAVVPGDGPRDGFVTLEVTASAGGVTLRRRAQFVFVPRQTTVLRVYLSSRCVAVTEICAGNVRCSVQEFCEQRGLTCGNEGVCVPVETTLGRDRDGSFGDVPAAERCGLYGMACCVVGAPCASPLSCVGGRCQRCADPDERCCSGGDLLSDGTPCAAVTGPCQRDGVCAGGACNPPTNVPNGTVCAPTSAPCRRDGVCADGACGPPAVAPNGTVCAPARNACEGDGVCAGGACGARAPRPDGTRLPGANQCCGGAPTPLDSPAHCGVCAQSCASGNCQLDPTYGHYYCRCTTSGQCPGGVCRTLTPGANNCACSTSCPGGTTCYMISGPNYCGY